MRFAELRLHEVDVVRTDSFVDSPKPGNGSALHERPPCTSGRLLVMGRCWSRVALQVTCVGRIRLI